ncbi:hypothetical protein [Deinococcus sp. Leaf326]|uniref:hypothetical protein n=1 Tax=Deinococcus sp. Leaf326 TaxID=1736338 RepID=UPI0006F42AB4|nr:hypothetical protein [Deinococcus sp. Leaf326]KQR22892.1 hypothetical protein ASF71_06915 [Deinococcus sp. Leaf326]
MSGLEQVRALLEGATPGTWKRLGTPTIWADLDSGRRVAVAENLSTNLATGDLLALAPDLARRVIALSTENAALASENAVLRAQAQAERPTQAELDAVRGYLIDVRSGSHTMGNLRHFANRHEHGDPSDIPECWAGTPDDAHVTKGMHAHVLWRAFRRAALAQASAGQAGEGGTGG